MYQLPSFARRTASHPSPRKARGLGTPAEGGCHYVRYSSPNE
jgi:hypothetical protein